MSILFDAIFILYCIIYFPYLLLTKRWHPDYLQRFGFFSPDIHAQLNHRGRNVWVHAVSVGEVMAIEGFIHQLKERWPGCAIVCTVTTKTGYILAKKRLDQKATVIFSPLDLSFVVAAFIRAINPKIYIAAETEIWPNLFAHLHKKSVPVVIINGRISDRSFGRYKSIKFLLKGVLANVSLFIMQSALDAGRIKELGAVDSKVLTVGNIKFDDAIAAVTGQALVSKEPVWIAGSTHPGEERIILDVFKEISGWRLVLAPRHVERTDDVMRQVRESGFKAIKLSQIKGDEDIDHVVVVDTIGQLRNLYSSASLVFVGKSLCVGGGHNIIEPAVFGKPIIIGPMMENFRDIVACFKSKDAILQVEDVEGFNRAVNDLINNESKRNTLGASAQAVVMENQGAVNRSLELIRKWF